MVAVTPATAAQQWPRLPEAARVRRAWGAGRVRAARRRHSPGQSRAVWPRAAGGAVPTSIMGCPGSAGEGRGGGLGGSGGFRAAPPGDAASSIRALSLPPLPRFGQSGLQPGGREEARGQGRSLYLALTRRVSGPRLRFPLRDLLPASPPPASTQIGPRVPGGASANSAGPRREAEPAPSPINAHFLSTDGPGSQ